MARADVVVSRQKNGLPKALIILTWRAGRPSPTAAAWAAELALRVVRDLSPGSLTVADTSGRVWYGQQVTVPAAQAESNGAPLWLGVLFGFLVATTGALLAFWWQRRRQVPQRAVEGQQLALPARRASALLRRSSPGVRGALLAMLSPEVRRAVQPRVGKRVDLPARAPAPEVLVAVLSALEADEKGDGR
ncbi:MAG: hypothetical protein N2512_10215 [Armatimonadetes bacterium]|nr:hypothetical protein [Armatimonadota bacterium]